MESKKGEGTSFGFDLDEELIAMVGLVLPTLFSNILYLKVEVICSDSREVER